MSDTITLSDTHRKLIQDSGISEAVAVARGYRTVTDSTDPALLDYSTTQRRLLPALYIPSYDVHGYQEGSQLRPDNPRMKDDKAIKYESASGASSFLDVHPTIRTRIISSVEPIIITEGVRKADAVNSQGGLCLALPGVWNWKSKVGESKATVTLPAFDSVPWKDRKVAIAFDSDVTRKREVKQALRRLVNELNSRKAKVEIILLPENGDKVGLDDYLALEGNTLETLWKLSADAEEVLGELDASYVAENYYPRTHLGNAERIARDYSDKIAWCPSTGWYFWSGEVWIRDAAHLVMRTIHSLRDIISSEIREMVKAGVEDSEIGKHIRLEIECQSHNHITSVMTQLQPLVLHTWDEFDTHPDMITVGNGTLVLGRFGDVELKPFDPADYITRRSEVNYVPDAKAPFFESTVDMALPDEEVKTFFQRAVGYSLLGGNSEQVIFMAHGSGENLKSTVLGAVKRAMGKELGLEVDPASLRPTGKGGSSASPDKMRLVGARMVLAAEASDKLDPEFLKRVSGGEEIVARQLHGKTISFVPDFTLWLMFNAPPSIEDSGHGMWRRVRVIPFTHRVENPIDSGTVNRLLDEQMEGVLAWVVQGYMDYKRHGLTPPEAVRIETQAMRDELDWMADFISQNYVIGEEGTFTRKPDLWREFEGWRGGDMELRQIRKLDFNAKLTDKWGTVKKVRGNYGWSGVRHKDDPLEENRGSKYAPEGKNVGKNFEDELNSSDTSTRDYSSQGAESTLGGNNFGVSFSYSENSENVKNEDFVESNDEKTDLFTPSAPAPIVTSENSEVEDQQKRPPGVEVYISHPYTSSIQPDAYRGSFDRLRGRENPAKLGTCGAVPWAAKRKGGCGTALVPMPGSDYIGVCPACYPESVS